MQPNIYTHSAEDSCLLFSTFWFNLIASVLNDVLSLTSGDAIMSLKSLVAPDALTSPLPGQQCSKYHDVLLVNHKQL
jgi:hypothetical protein